MPTTGRQLTETQVRAMRDRVYGQPSTDKNWDGCKDKWMQPENIERLMEKDASPNASHGNH